MSVNTARMLNRIFSSPAWKLLLIIAVLAFIGCFIFKGKKRRIPVIACIASVCLFLITGVISSSANNVIVHQAGTDPEKIGGNTRGLFSALINGDTPGFSEDTMFSLRIYQPWFYESLHYTLQTDGTLIVQYYDTELGREKLSDEKMEEIRKVFSPEKVYSMNVGREDDRTDGTSRYIILYDHDGNEIEIGGYELKGGDHFNRYFYKLYALLEDDYTKQWSDKLDECMRDCVTYGERYLNWGQAAAGSQQGGEDIGTPDALGASSADGGAVPTPDVSSPDEGIEYDYWLRLDKMPGDYYEANVDDINYKLTDYSNYITVFITNNGSEDAYIGGEYRLQRLTGGKYTDIQDGVDMIYAGVHVQDMPLIVLHDNADGSVITLADETDQFVIKPGQTIKAEFLTMRYAIFDYPEYEGEYRFIYGNVVIDFKLYCDTVC